MEDLLKKIKFIAFDFDGVFTDNKVFVDETGHEMVRCSRLDGIGIARLNKIGVKSIIISSEKNHVVQARANKLKIECFNNIQDKRSIFLDYCKSLNIDPLHSAFVGNDINDIEVLKVAGISIGVKDCMPEIEEYLDFKLSRKGGDGAVREICDLIYLKNYGK
jgi:YrbI family 3-deoxy-D-manno-octulosonate 8-phosphate phosphatase